jgi:hypothetical protein
MLQFIRRCVDSVESHCFVTVALHETLAEGNKEICEANVGFRLKI